MTKSSELLRQKASRARILANDAINAGVRYEFLRLAEKLEAAASAEEEGEGAPKDPWPFR
jgi:hypothetical protein